MAKRTPSFPISWRQLLLALLCTFTVFYLVALIGTAVQGYRVKKQVDTLRAEVNSLEEKSGQLRSDLDYVKSDAYVEKVAREELKWSRPGEKVFVPVPEEKVRPIDLAVTPVPAPPPLLPKTSVPHWQEWKELLFGPKQ